MSSVSQDSQTLSINVVVALRESTGFPRTGDSEYGRADVHNIRLENQALVGHLRLPIFRLLGSQ